MVETNEKIAAVETSAEILEAILSLKEVGVTELARELDLPKSTVYSHLYTLREIGFVVGHDGRYRLSLRFLEFGERRRQSEQLYETAKPELDDLAEETGELVNLLVEEGDEGVYLYLSEGENAVQLDTYAGMRVPLYCTALGKVTLAYMDSERLKSYLAECDFAPLTPNTITDSKAIMDEVEDVREQGFAIDHGERAGELNCVAVPILVENSLEGAISVTAPKPRMRGDRLTDKIPKILADTASVIQINMVYR